MRRVKLLDTTLRDGSYSVNFSFSSVDTSLICKELESAGVELIEVGHGVGLNASNSGYGQAMQTDEEYMMAAESVLQKAAYGMFCIPGIGRLQDIDLASKHKMGFLRVGTNVTEVEKSESYIKKAKDYGMYVTANYMKSYSSTPEKFAEKVKLSAKYGADAVYIVDSAGGMFANDIVAYYDAIRKVSDISVGFHGHDNLGLAIANSLSAADSGIELIDSSLQGLGRSSGNACTEVLVSALTKKGISCGIDLLKLIRIGENYIQPLITTRGRMPLDIIAGYADFHSSYMHHILKYSSKYLIDPALLIIEATKIDKVDVDEKVLDTIAQNIKGRGEVYTAKYRFDRYIGNEQEKRNASNS